LKLHYKDYSEWQNREKKQGVLKQQEFYWLKEFEEKIPALNLPTDFERPMIHNFEGHTVRFAIGSEETKALKKIALNEEVTLFMVLFAITNIFLSKLSGQEKIIVGTPVLGRTHSDLEGIIGMFVNTLAIKNSPAAGKTFIEFLGEVKKKSLEAFDNQDYPFEDLVDKVTPGREGNRNPLFDVMFTLHTIDKPPGEKSEKARTKSTFTQYKYENKTSLFDLILTGIAVGDELTFLLEYSTDLFMEETIERFIGYFKEIVSSVLDNKMIKLKEISLSHHFDVARSKISHKDIEGFEF
jgi:non-ribosomal peptide synthetase component F